MTQGSPEEIANRFQFHAAKDADVQARHEHVRNSTHTAALAIVAVVPECAERTLAIRKLEEAMFWANAGIARNQ